VKSFRCPDCTGFLCELETTRDSRLRLRLVCRRCRQRLFIIIKDGKAALVIDSKRSA
jgi:uncharacterized protein YbaR (Trm112 family)